MLIYVSAERCHGYNPQQTQTRRTPVRGCNRWLNLPVQLRYRCSAAPRNIKVNILVFKVSRSSVKYEHSYSMQSVTLITTKAMDMVNQLDDSQSHKSFERSSLSKCINSLIGVI